MITLYVYKWMMPWIGILLFLISFDIIALVPNEYKEMSLPFGLGGVLFLGTWIVITLGEIIQPNVVMIP